jgi:hypothetical protein
MKRFYILASCILIASLGFAQITVNPRVTAKEGPNSGDRSPVSILTNNATDPLDTEFRWTVLEMNEPSGWQIDFCDPFRCIPNVSIGSTYDFSVAVGQAGIMKADFYFNGNSGSGSLKAAISSKRNPSITDTITFNATAWVTSVRKVTKSNTVTFSPNPVVNEMTFNFPASKQNPIHVDIYNILGTKVKSFTHSDEETLVNLEQLQNGVYFIRFMDSGKLYTKQFTKVDQ